MQPVLLFAQVFIIMSAIWMTMIVERVLLLKNKNPLIYFSVFTCIIVSIEYLVISIVNTLDKQIVNTSQSTDVVTTIVFPNFENDVFSSLYSWRSAKSP